LSITPDKVDLCHPDAKINRAALDYYFRLVDFAAEVGAPLFACHGLVGRVRAVGSYPEEWYLMATAAREIASCAAQRNLRVAIELLNRYEAHFLNHVNEGLRFGYCYWTQLIIQKALSDGSNCPRPSRKWPCVSSESQGALASFPALH